MSSYCSHVPGCSFAIGRQTVADAEVNWTNIAAIADTGLDVDLRAEKRTNWMRLVRRQLWPPNSD